MAAPFRRVALIENPGSGMTSARRRSAVQSAIPRLKELGSEIEHLLIDGPGSGAALARQAVQNGCDAVLVCGGDGTIHEVLQPLVGTNVALGVLPMGTANALAADLGLSRDPRAALEMLLASSPVAVPVGRITFQNKAGEMQSRYFTVAAGIGADALLMARMDPVLKRRLGYIVYVVEALRIWIGHSFPLFGVTFQSLGEPARSLHASQLLAVRVRSFGGVLGRLAPGATLHGQKLCVIAFRTRSRLHYLQFLLAAMVKRQTFGQQVELIETDSVECSAASGEQIFVEADGELLGTLPATLEMATETLTLLMPQAARP